MNNLIIKVPEGYVPEPLDCPVCQLAFSSKEDVFNYRQYECCRDCDLKYRYPNKERWDKGWRPKMKGQEEDN